MASRDREADRAQPVAAGVAPLSGALLVAGAGGAGAVGRSRAAAWGGSRVAAWESRGAAWIPIRTKRPRSTGTVAAVERAIHSQHNRGLLLEAVLSSHRWGKVTHLRDGRGAEFAGAA